MVAMVASSGGGGELGSLFCLLLVSFSGEPQDADHLHRGTFHVNSGNSGVCPHVPRSQEKTRTRGRQTGERTTTSDVSP